jgi:hypothetical protein
VAFAQEELRRATRNDRWTWRLIAESTYEVCAKILHPDRHALVLEVGLSVYSNYQSRCQVMPYAPGDWVEGTADLLVDSSSPVRGLAHRKRFPPLIYTWTSMWSCSRALRGCSRKAATFLAMIGPNVR